MVTITGGETTLDAEADGIDSNGSILVTGGATTVFGSPEDREGALDANGMVAVDGGTLLAVGTTGMAVSPAAESEQGWLSASLDQTYGAGQAVQVLDGFGTRVAEFTSVKSFQSVVLSTAEIVDGATYTVTVGGQTAGTATAGVTAARGTPPGGGRRP
jgi:hypothetical protein